MVWWFKVNIFIFMNYFSSIFTYDTIQIVFYNQRNNCRQIFVFLIAKRESNVSPEFKLFHERLHVPAC